MLKSLYIANYALIDSLEIDFYSGFSSLTGETGAGKSIILGALSLILGQRADTKVVQADKKCVIEATFDISNYDLKQFFTENDIDFSAEQCIIRRELNALGKTRAFINDTPVSLVILRNLSIQLIDIHSQHDNLLLVNPDFQLDVVDILAANSAIKLQYATHYDAWLQLQNERNLLSKNAVKWAANMDFIRFQWQQLADAQLLVGEQEALELEHEMLAHATELKQELMQVEHLMQAEVSVLALLKETKQNISKLKPMLKVAGDWEERLQSTFIELKDINSEIVSFAERIQSNPERLETVENRLSELFHLQKKFKAISIHELIELRNGFENQLSQIESFDETLAVLDKKIEQSKIELTQTAKVLTNSRLKVVPEIEMFMIQKLSELGMPNVRFKIDVRRTESFHATGSDEVQFLFTANKNRPMQAVKSIASGGEIARLMLTIKALIADKSNLATIIFDEIDTGVSGEIAHRMGEIMYDMGKCMQVITITHLPQIASKSTHQYRVYKQDDENHTTTGIEKLTPEQRITEIAHMLSGKKLTEIAILNAKELLRL